MIKRFFTHKLTFLMIAGALLTTAFVAMPTGTAFAQEESPTRDINGRLTRGLVRLQEASNKLQERLGKVDALVTRGEEWIAKLQENGVETAVLEDALATFQTRAATAQGMADAGVQILADHAGFDDNGQVTDRGQAAQTLSDAAETLRSGHQELRQAGTDLRQIVRDFRRDHRGNE